MAIEKNKSLINYNTFRIDVKAKYFTAITSVNTLVELAIDPIFRAEKKMILGGGSNLLLTKDVDALVIKNDIKGIEILSENKTHIELAVGAGENWHELVLYCVENNFGGLENLSLIPGNVGAAPMQNIGAYGVEIKDTFQYLEAFNIRNSTIEKFTNSACEFGYRESRFKKDLKGKYIITKVVFKLKKAPHQLNTNYGDISKELEKANISNPKIKDISNAVITIRKRKLPDPNEIGNSGSFFKNPVINKAAFELIIKKYPNVAHYKLAENEIKIAAGWLIEKAGWKGKKIKNYGVHQNQALVLVNYGGAKGSDIHELSKLIIEDIYKKFKIRLEQEVNIL